MARHRFGPELCAALLAALLAACAPVRPDAPRCAAGQGRPMLVFDLFFGRAVRARGDVTDAEWQAFRDAVITPGLPNGYTLLDADGAWMNPVTRTTIQERTKVLVVALPSSPGRLAAIDHIRNEYQVRFHQQRVGMTVQPGCGSF